MRERALSDAALACQQSNVSERNEAIDEKPCAFSIASLPNALAPVLKDTVVSP